MQQRQRSLSYPWYESEKIAKVVRTLCLLIEGAIFVRVLTHGLNPGLLIACVVVALIYGCWPSRRLLAERAFEKRLRPIRLSVCPPERYPELEELFQKNEAYGVPPEKRPDYADALRSGRILTFIAELEGKLVGTVSLQYVAPWQCTALCYLLIDPAVFRQGVGSTLVLACLAMLPGPCRLRPIVLFGTSGRDAFYAQLGFTKYSEYTARDGRKETIALLRFYPQSCISARIRLKRAGAALPDHALPLPGMLAPGETQAPKALVRFSIPEANELTIYPPAAAVAPVPAPRPSQISGTAAKQWRALYLAIGLVVGGGAVLWGVAFGLGAGIVMVFLAVVIFHSTQPTAAQAREEAQTPVPIQAEATAPALPLGALQHPPTVAAALQAQAHIEQKLPHLSPLRIRLGGPDHFLELDILHTKNTAHGVPTNDLPYYKEFLRSGRVATFIAQADDGKILGTFGLQYSHPMRGMVLCYLLVDPVCHRQGVGTTLLLAAQALIPPEHRQGALLIYGLPNARPFYDRFGYVHLADFHHPDDRKDYLGRLWLVPELCTQAEVWLQRVGVTLPEQPVQIPSPDAAAVVVERRCRVGLREAWEVCVRLHEIRRWQSHRTYRSYRAYRTYMFYLSAAPPQNSLSEPALHIVHIPRKNGPRRCDICTVTFSSRRFCP